MKKIVTQRCESCGKEFRVSYETTGIYDYIDEPCDCIAPFYPVDGPSIFEWLESLDERAI